MRYRVYLLTTNRTELVEAPDSQTALVKVAQIPAVKLLRERAKALELKLKMEVELVNEEEK